MGNWRLTVDRDRDMPAIVKFCIGAGLFGSFLLQGCFLVAPVHLESVDRVQFEKPGGSGEISFELSLRNPNGYSVEVTKSTCELRCADSVLATMDLLESVTLTRHESMRIPSSFRPADPYGTNPATAAFHCKDATGFTVGGSIVVKKWIFTRRKSWQAVLK